MSETADAVLAEEPLPTEVIFVSVRDAQAILGLGRPNVYRLLDEGLIESRFYRRRRLVVLASVKAFAAGLPDERAEP